MFKSKKSSAVNTTINKIAAQAPAVTTIAGAAAAVGMAAYWLVSAANVIKASKPQQENKPAEENQK